MRRFLKTVGEYALGSRMVLRAFGAIRPNDGVVLAYHNIVPRGPSEGDLSLHLPLETFLSQVDWLADVFDVVSLNTFLDGTPGTRPKAVITFDDAYAGAVRHAIPALVERGLPSTLFVVSSWVGGEVTWWDALAGNDGLSKPLRHEALYGHAGLESAVIDWARRDGILPAEISGDRRIATTENIQQVASSPLVSIGMHGHAHANLCALGDDELADELASSFRETRETFPNAWAWLAFPYGLSDLRVAEAARVVGFERAFLVSGGPVRSLQRVEDFAIPRVNVPSGLSLAGFRMRTAGIP